MRCVARVLLAALVCACARQPSLPVLPADGPVAVTSTAVAVVPGRCRVGPDGGIPVADRGIGGTGIAMADRGIGGTGSPTTGIVGVITGFASVCLAGQEVPYGLDVPVLVDGRPGGLGDLRVGQVAAVGAVGAQPFARTVAVRHEVSGPLDRVNADGTLLVAGQRVIPPPGFVPGSVPGRGAWLLVSGFRRADGVILATRLDLRGPGETTIRGILRAEGGRRWIGGAEVRLGPGQSVPPGTPVVAIGRWNDGVLEAGTVEPDGLLVDASAYFGGAGVLVIEGYAEGGSFGFGGRRYDAPFGRGFGVLRLQRGLGGRFDAVSVRPFERERGPAGAGFVGGPRAAFSPAPTPNRGDERGFGGLARGGPSIGREDGQGRDRQTEGGRGGLGSSGRGGPGGFLSGRGGGGR